jgi:hypothetical protein
MYEDLWSNAVGFRHRLSSFRPPKHYESFDALESLY